MSVLQVIDLKKYYRQGENLIKALDGVSLEIEAGEFAAIVGTSGSGKSTLLHMMGGLDNPTSGKVLINGEDISRKNEEQLTVFRRRHIGFVFQSYNLVPVLNVYENIVLPLKLDGKRIDQRLLKEVIDVLGLEHKLEALPGNLSGGQQQRVSIARAMITHNDAIAQLADRNFWFMTFHMTLLPALLLLFRDFQCSLYKENGILCVADAQNTVVFFCDPVHLVQAKAMQVRILLRGLKFALLVFYQIVTVRILAPDGQKTMDHFDLETDKAVFRIWDRQASIQGIFQHIHDKTAQIICRNVQLCRNLYSGSERDLFLFGPLCNVLKDNIKGFIFRESVVGGFFIFTFQPLQ